MPTRLNSAQQILSENAELSARVKLAESIAAQRLAENEALKKENEQLKAAATHYCERSTLLEEELRWIRSQYFSSSSQKQDPAAVNSDQRMLFNEAEVLTAIEEAEEAHRNRTSKIEAHERKHTGGRKAIPEHFPRIQIPHDLSEAQKMCTRCPVPHPLTRIGQETRLCYRFEPPKVSVEEHIRFTYACTETHEGVITAPNPPTLLPKSMASPSLLAYIVTTKFDDHVPLYRVSRQLERYGMDLGPGTIGTWVNKIGGQKIVPLVKLLNEGIFTVPFWHMDESYLQVLHSEKAPRSDHFIVVRAGGPPGKRIILYDYIPSRTTDGLKKLLINAEGQPYRGKLLTDGLERYDEICEELQLLHFGCLQHCRAYYYKARKVSQLPSSRTLANAAIDDYLRQVFAVETTIETLRAQYAQRGDTLLPEAVSAIRQEKSKPVLEQFKEWVDKLLPGTPPNSALGKALTYTMNQWPKLVRHLDHGDVPAHNNFAERQIKQYALGRKAWLFVYDKFGAQASANLFTLVMTCRANDVQPYAYLCYLFERLPMATTLEELEALLPWNVKLIIEEEEKKKRLAVAT